MRIICSIDKRWRLFRQRQVRISTGVLLGALLWGWGLFNLVARVLNHYLFRLHNVREQVANPQAWNLGFFILALVQLAIGWGIFPRCRSA